MKMTELHGRNMVAAVAALALAVAALIHLDRALSPDFGQSEGAFSPSTSAGSGTTRRSAQDSAPAATNARSTASICRTSIEDALFHPLLPLRPAGAPGNWIQDEDYPPAALRANQAGISAVHLSVGIDGRVASCEVTSSSGHPVLDATACDLLKLRARFVPARDANGCALPGEFSTRVRWQIPTS